MKKSRVILFIVALVYNIVLGIWLRNFLCLSPTLQVFYLISLLPTFFLLFEIKSKAMRSVVFVLLALIFLMNFAYAVYCRRVFTFLVIFSIAIVGIYFTAFAGSTRKDNLLTKIYVLILSALISVLLFSAYFFVYKQDDVLLTNGQATLWDTQTVELADEICADCDTDEIKEAHLCDKCGKCIKACPGNAIDENGIVDPWQCSVYYNGANGTKNPFMPPDAFADFDNRIEIIAGEAKVTTETAKKILDSIFFYPPAQHAYQCSICGRACDTACYMHLEEKGVLNKKFNRHFRTREEWRFDIKDFT